jgi:hypothetical protein
VSIVSTCRSDEVAGITQTMNVNERHWLSLGIAAILKKGVAQMASEQFSSQIRSQMHEI